MNTINKLLAATATVALLAGAAGSAQALNITQLPDKGAVTLTGTVEKVKDEREFVLRDESGKIDVEIKSNQSVVIKPGDKVTVTGSVDSGLISKSIDATNVEVSKNLSEAVSDAVATNTSTSTEGAQSVAINQLPREGMVKVSGTVNKVDNEKEFTLKDATGSVDIQIQSSESAALTEGAQVTVIGYVDSGLMSKEIRATRVIVADGKTTITNPL